MILGAPCAAVRSGFYSKERGMGWGGLNRRDMLVLGSSKTPLSSRGGSTVRGEDGRRKTGPQRGDDGLQSPDDKEPGWPWVWGIKVQRKRDSIS